jgi:hypothetical protein
MSNSSNCKILKNFSRIFIHFEYFFLSFDHSPRKSVKKQFNITWKKPFKRCIWSIFTSCAECRFKESSAVYFYFKFLKVVLPLALDSAFATFFLNSKDSRSFFRYCSTFNLRIWYGSRFLGVSAWCSQRQLAVHLAKSCVFNTKFILHFSRLCKWIT